MHKNEYISRLSDLSKQKAKSMNNLRLTFCLIALATAGRPIGHRHQRNWAFADLMSPDGSYNFAKRV